MSGEKRIMIPAHLEDVLSPAARMELRERGLPFERDDPEYVAGLVARLRAEADQYAYRGHTASPTLLRQAADALERGD